MVKAHIASNAAKRLFGHTDLFILFFIEDSPWSLGCTGELAFSVFFYKKDKQWKPVIKEKSAGA